VLTYPQFSIFDSWATAQLDSEPPPSPPEWSTQRPFVFDQEKTRTTLC